MKNFLISDLETMLSGPTFVLSSRVSTPALSIYKEARRDRLYEALATPPTGRGKVLNPDSDSENPDQDI